MVSGHVSGGGCSGAAEDWEKHNQQEWGGGENGMRYTRGTTRGWAIKSKIS